MRKLIAVGLILCILFTVLVSGASAAPKKDKVVRGTISSSNHAYATAHSEDKPSYATATSYVGMSVGKKGINVVGVTQASASGNSAYVYSDQTLNAHFNNK
jgi:hypothetical protein